MNIGPYSVCMKCSGLKHSHICNYFVFAYTKLNLIRFDIFALILSGNHWKEI